MHYCIHHSLTLTSLTVPAEPQCRDGIGQVMSGAWFPLDVQTSEFDLCFSCFESPSNDFWQTPGAFY